MSGRLVPIATAGAALEALNGGPDAGRRMHRGNDGGQGMSERVVSIESTRDLAAQWSRGSDPTLRMAVCKTATTEGAA